MFRWIVSRNEGFEEAAIGAAELVSHLAQRCSQVLGVAAVYIGQGQVQALKLVDDKPHIVADFHFSLSRRQFAVRGERFSRRGQPGIVQLPVLNLSDDVTSVTRDRVGCFQGVVSWPEGLGIVVELQVQ